VTEQYLAIVTPIIAKATVVQGENATALLPPVGLGAAQALLANAGPFLSLSLALTTATFTGLAAGQTVTLTSKANLFMMLVVNGLVQAPGSFSVNGYSLIIPPGLVWDGAECFFVYQT
jgi:hypothetical protein